LVGKAGSVVGVGNSFVGDSPYSGNFLNMLENAQFGVVDGLDFFWIG
jgi:hypothetical protein